MDIVNKIVRMIEVGELDMNKEKHIVDQYEVSLNKKNFKDHGLDGLIIEINSNGNRIARLLYDAWNRTYIKDNELKICKTT